LLFGICDKIKITDANLRMRERIYETYESAFLFVDANRYKFMGRKKKIKNNEEESSSAEIEESSKKPKINIAGDAKRSAVAVFLFALAALMILAFLGYSGMVGEYLEKIVGQLIGLAKYIFTLFLIMAGIILLLRKETSFYTTKLLGLIVIFLSIIAFFHWLYPAREWLKMATKGQGGGYVGYILVWASEKFLGSAGSLVVIITLFIIGLIVTFDFSLIKLIEKFFKKQMKGEDENAMAPSQENGPVAEIEKIEDKHQSEMHDAENNIGKIEFVEGPDQYVSSSLSNGSIGPELPHEKIFRKKTLRTRNARKNKIELPPLDLLEESTGNAKGGDVNKNAEIIERTLRNFGIEVERGEIKTGPSVTQYSFRPAVGIKISKIMALQNDLALALAAHSVRIEAPIPGKSLVGIEVPNKTPAIVRLRGILESNDFRFRKSNLMLALGEDVSGNFIFGDLAKMPHLMIAGATGTGKSVCINSIITSLLYQNTADDLKFIMVDPKRVELSLYNKIPHLKADVVVDNAKVVNALKWAVGEMERRYRLLQDAGSRDISSYKEQMKSGKTKNFTDPETGEVTEEDLENLPYIVIIIDELADLMGSHGKEVEGAVVRLAQMARAVGIHLIVSTQRPSVEVITGLIKANITTRIAFGVATQIDSRTILDMGGAEKLLGNGDMLYLNSSSPKPQRIQGVFVSESEVKRVVKFFTDQKGEEKEIGEDITSSEKGNLLEFNDSATPTEQEDALYEAAKAEVIRAKKASASLLQRRLRVGYARAARLLDILEEQGIVGPSDGAKPREVYVASDGKEVDYENTTEDQEVRDKWNL